MKPKLIRALLFVILAVCGLTQIAGTQQSETTPQDLVALDKKWGEVVANKDAVGLGEILADDFVGVGDNGAKYTKPDEIKQLESRKPTDGSYSADDYDVRFLDKDTALMLHRGSFSGKEDGKDVFEEHRSLHVFVRRDGRWKVIASDATPIAR
jgi:ketosteroid isomerase-like protein